jgi:hypothetical protein
VDPAGPKAGKHFFFEKKKQKTFTSSPQTADIGLINKNFCFFQNLSIAPKPPILPVWARRTRPALLISSGP